MNGGIFAAAFYAARRFRAIVNKALNNSLFPLRLMVGDVRVSDEASAAHVAVTTVVRPSPREQCPKMVSSLELFWVVGAITRGSSRKWVSVLLAVE